MKAEIDEILTVCDCQAEPQLHQLHLECHLGVVTGEKPATRTVHHCLGVQCVHW